MSPRFLLVIGSGFLVGAAGQDYAESPPTIWEALWNLKFESSEEEGWRLWKEGAEEERLEALAISENYEGGLDQWLAASGSDETDSSNSTNNTNNTNVSLSSSTTKRITAISKLIVAPIVLFVGQDVEQLLHVINGLMVGGIGSLTTKISSLEKFDPTIVVDIGAMLTAASGSIAATLQNPGMGAVVQGGVIFKQLSAQVVKLTYQRTMQQLGDCEGIDYTKTSAKYPHGTPLNCSKVFAAVPVMGEVTGEELGLYVMTAVEYGLVAIGAYVSPYLALIMCIFNAASVGGHMLLDGFEILAMWLMPKFGYSAKRVHAAKILLDAYALRIWMGLVAAGFTSQLIARLLRHKGAGHGPFKHLRFRVTEARGGGAAWASISDILLYEHKIAIDIPDEYQEPPQEGQKAWVMTFDEPVEMTQFCFLSGNAESKVEDDPVSWFVEVSTKEGDEPPPEDDKSWLVIHEAKQEKVPKARNAKSAFFKFTAPKEPEPEEGLLGAAAAAATGAASSAAGAASSAAGAASGALGSVEKGAKEGEAEVKGCCTKMKLKLLRLKYQGTQMKPKVEEKIQTVKKFIKEKMAFAKTVGKKGQDVVKGCMAPFSVINHVVRELTDKTAGKDKKSKQQIVMEALHGLGWEEPMLKKVMHQTLQMLLKKFEVAEDIIKKIVDSCHAEELEEFFKKACNREFGGFVKDLEDVLRKLMEEEKEEMEAVLKPIKDQLDIALREFYMEESAIVISKAFFTSFIEARMYLLTLQDVTGPDGTVICAGRFKDLDLKDQAETNDIKLMNEYLEKFASGKPFPGRTQHVAKMKEWLKEDEKHLAEHIKKEMGFAGEVMVKAQPYVKNYSAVMKNYTMAKNDPKGYAVGLATPYKDMIVKKVKSKMDEYRQKATKAAMDKVADVEKQAQDAAAGAMAKAAELKEQATDAALAQAGAAANAAEKAAQSASSAAGGLDLEAQAASKSVVPEAKHGAIEDSDAPFVALPNPDDAPDATGDEYHDLLAAMVEQKANKEMVIDDLNKKLGLTIEQAKRLTGYMSDKECAHINACGGVTLPGILKLAERFGVHFNTEKAEETQKLVQAHKMKKELEASGPPYERKKAAKKAANMTPADISNRMSKPATQRPPNPPDMKKVVKGLKKEIEKEQKAKEKLQEEKQKLEEDKGNLEKQVEEQKKKLENIKRPDEKPEIALRKLIDARANPAEAIEQSTVKKLLAARVNPQDMMAAELQTMVKQIPPEAQEKMGVGPADPASKIVEAILKEPSAKPQEMLTEIVKQSLAQDDIKKLLG